MSRFTLRRMAMTAALAFVATVAVVAGQHGDGRTLSRPVELVSVDPATGSPLTTADQEPSISADGNIVVFNSVLNQAIYTAMVRDRARNTTTPIPAPANVSSMQHATVSSDGCHVAFWGLQRTGGGEFVTQQYVLYVWNRCANTAAVPVTGGFTVNAYLVRPALSSDGHFVAYAAATDASSPYHLALVDTVGGGERPVPISPRTPLRMTTTVDVNGDGSVVVFDAGLNGSTTTNAVLAWTVASNTLTQVSVTASGTAASGLNAMPSISADGRRVAFVSNSPELAAADGPPLQVYVRDLGAGVTKLVTTITGTPMPQNALQPDISADGSQVAFTSRPLPSATGVSVGRLTSIVVVARSTSGIFDTVALDVISVDPTGQPAAGISAQPAMSSSGRFTVFASDAGASLIGNAKFPAGVDVWLGERTPALVAPAKLNFGGVDVGATSAPATVKVTNPSTIAVTLGTIAAPGSPFAIVGDTCSGTVLAAGAGCTVSVVFSPVAEGPVASNLLIGGEGLTAPVALTGSGRLRRALSLEPTSVTFSPTPLGGQSGPLTIAARNAGQAPVAIQSVTLGGAGADQFAVVSSDCSGATLAPGSACSIGLVAKPTRVGASAATLTVTGQQGESAAATLDVDGQPMAVLTITPAAVAFPSTIVGTSGPAVDLAVANTGGSPVTISAVALQGAGADQFTVAADGCTTIVLAVGASCTVSLAPVPTRAGQQTAVFLVTGDGGQSASATLDVLAGIAPTLRMNPAVVRPGDVTVAVGAGFPPNRDVALSFSRGTNTYKVTTDATGAFRLTIVMLRNGLPIGGMQLIAADQTDFTGVRAPLLVDQASFQPSASRDAAFTNGVTTMFARHG